MRARSSPTWFRSNEREEEPRQAVRTCALARTAAPRAWRSPSGRSQLIDRCPSSALKPFLTLVGARGLAELGVPSFVTAGKESQGLARSHLGRFHKLGLESRSALTDQLLLKSRSTLTDAGNERPEPPKIETTSARRLRRAKPCAFGLHRSQPEYDWSRRAC
jgi:hypothetical protein